MSPEETPSSRRTAGPGTIVVDFLRRPEQLPECSRYLLSRSGRHFALFYYHSIFLVTFTRIIYLHSQIAPERHDVMNVKNLNFETLDGCV